MSFQVKPLISDCRSMLDFLSQWNVGERDLIISNKCVLTPQIDASSVNCDVLYQEEYGKGEPNDEMIDAILNIIANKQYERIIAIGGGTVIDISKLLIFENGLSCEEIFERAANLSKRRKLLILPTTCGTGSEVTNISIVEFRKSKTKIGLAVPAFYPDEAILIPSLLSSLPYDVFATSTIDALIHAVESYISPSASEFSRVMGRRAIELILSGYLQIAKTGLRVLPENLKDYLVASTMAGISFDNAGCATVHALAYPIGGSWHISHGMANYLIFQEVFATYKALDVNLLPLETVLARILECDIQNVWEPFFDLLSEIYDLQKLSSLGADVDKCAEMAELVVKNQQRLLKNSPVSLSREDIQKIYTRCL